MIIKFIKDFFTKGHQRTILAKKNIAASFVIKGILLLVGFIKVPLFLDYIGNEKYGILIAILSLVNWINYFDLGIGNGLRNHLAIAIANNDEKEGKKLVSTAYVSFIILTFFLLTILIPSIFFINWNTLLNVNNEIVSNENLQISILIIVITFMIRFVLNLLVSIFRAHQLPALGNIFLPIGSLLSLTLIVLLKQYTDSSLLLAVLVSTIPTLIVLIIMNIYFFSTRYKKLRPQISFFSINHLREVFILGIKFFLLQMAAMLMFSFSNIIILRFDGADSVTIYSIANKLISSIYLFYSFILTPFWTGFTDAYTKKEYNWITKSVEKLIKITIVFSIIVFLVALMSDYIFKIWLGNRVSISLILVFSISLHQSTKAFATVYGSFINGVGKLQASLWLNIIIVIVFFPIAIYCTSLFGAVGFVLTLVFVKFIPTIILNKYQYNLVINNRAKGIWDR